MYSQGVLAICGCDFWFGEEVGMMGSRRKELIYESDLLIIGGGVVGTAIAHQFAQYDLRVALVEQGADLASGTSKANSGIIHSGYNANLRMLKGRLNLRGVELIYPLCEQLQVPVKQVGSMVVGYSEEEAEQVRKMMEVAKVLGLGGMELLEGEALFRVEPNLNPAARVGMLARKAGIISPYEFTFALAENAALNGVKFFRGMAVTDILLEKYDLPCPWKRVVTKEGVFRTKVVINAAGLFADEIGAMVGDTEFTITPRRGEYYVYDKGWGELVNHVLFPVPSQVSKGILVTPTVDGNLLVGPNAEERAVEVKGDTATTAAGLAEVLEGGRRVLPELGREGIINQFAGVRAVIQETEDFFIQPSRRCMGVFHVAGIQSPGLTAAPAIAEYVAQWIEALGYVEMKRKEDFAFRREPVMRWGELSRAEQAELIKGDRRYGQVICRCEQVTEAEVIDAIVRPVGALTVGGVKRRVRSGMGRCQGGFCGPKVLELLAEFGEQDQLDVTKEGGNSVILCKPTKERRGEDETGE